MESPDTPLTMIITPSSRSHFTEDWGCFLAAFFLWFVLFLWLFVVSFVSRQWSDIFSSTALLVFSIFLGISLLFCLIQAGTRRYSATHIQQVQVIASSSHIAEGTPLQISYTISFLAPATASLLFEVVGTYLKGVDSYNNSSFGRVSLCQDTASRMRGDPAHPLTGQVTWTITFPPKVQSIAQPITWYLSIVLSVRWGMTWHQQALLALHSPSQETNDAHTN
jgi:hypothetical protein